MSARFAAPLAAAPLPACFAARQSGRGPAPLPRSPDLARELDGTGLRPQAGVVDSSADLPALDRTEDFAAQAAGAVEDQFPRPQGRRGLLWRWHERGILPG